MGWGKPRVEGEEPGGSLLAVLLLANWVSLLSHIASICNMGATSSLTWTVAVMSLGHWKRLAG